MRPWTPHGQFGENGVALTKNRCVPKGRLNTSGFSRPSARMTSNSRHPTLRRWGIVKCPSGTESTDRLLAAQFTRQPPVSH